MQFKSPKFYNGVAKNLIKRGWKYQTKQSHFLIFELITI